MTKYRTPILEAWEGRNFESYRILGTTKENLKQWRAFQQAIAIKLYIGNTLLAEELNLQFYETNDLKYLCIPVRGTYYSDANLVEHYRQTRAAWHMIEVSVTRVHSEGEGFPLSDEEVAMDDIGILNLENALEA